VGSFDVPPKQSTSYHSLYRWQSPFERYLRAGNNSAMGNEQYGIRDEVKAMADATFYLPMTGLLAESFNFRSVGTAITCAHFSAVSRDGTGHLRPRDLSIMLVQRIFNERTKKAGLPLLGNLDTLTSTDVLGRSA
jgi:hypothetical protein